MNEKVTDILLNRIKYFINSIENGEYAPQGYEFAIKFHSKPNCPNNKVLSIEDSYAKKEEA